MLQGQDTSSMIHGNNTSPMESSCAGRVLVLIDVSRLAAQQGANDLEAAKFIDSLRLSLLRILAQFSLSCPKDSWVEWSTRFFDSRHDGVGKTPSELKARLRSRKASQGKRGFTRLTRATFEAFGNACLAVACGLQGDPLARDHEVSLRRWSRGRKEKPHDM